MATSSDVSLNVKILMLLKIVPFSLNQHLFLSNKVDFLGDIYGAYYIYYIRAVLWTNV